MTKPKPHKFYCWMRVIPRPTGAVHIMIPSKPPPRKTAKANNPSDYDEVWIGIEPYYNEPTTSAFVLDYWSGGSGEAFADQTDAENWLKKQAGKDWLDEAVYYTLMAFNVAAK